MCICPATPVTNINTKNLDAVDIDRPRPSGCIWTIPKPVAPSEPANQLTAPVTPRTRRGGVIIMKPDDELAAWLPADTFQGESSDLDSWIAGF